MSLEELLFYGSRRAFFRTVPGSFRSHCYPTEEPPGRLDTTCLRRHAVPAACEELVLPAVPAPDLQPRYSDATESRIPSCLRIAPLLKCERDIADEPSGLDFAAQSGRRSALVRCGATWWRLKGCGDLESGFPLAPAPPDGLQIRGCMFSHTCARELAVTRQASAALAMHSGAPFAWLGANDAPCGWYDYEVAEGDRFPGVARCCAVMRSRAERRLFTHVLCGIEELLPLLVPCVSAAEIASHRGVPAARAPDGIIGPSWPIQLTEGSAALCDLRGIALRAPAQLAVPASVPEQWKPLWNAYASQLTTEGTLPLPELYWRLGRDTGIALHCLHAAHISWGTYADDLAFHCNAHPNNLAVLPPGEAPTASDQWLAPLDFDMAFGQREYSGALPFAEVVAAERAAMPLSLAGDEELNSGASTAAPPLQEPYDSLRWALRDTAVRACCDALEGGWTAANATAVTEAQCRCIIGLALIATANNVA